MQTLVELMSVRNTIQRAGGYAPKYSEFGGKRTSPVQNFKSSKSVSNPERFGFEHAAVRSTTLESW